MMLGSSSLQPTAGRPSWASTALNMVLHALALLFLCAARSEAALTSGKNLAKELLHMDDTNDLAIATIFVFIGYTLQYSSAALVFEATHPYGIMSKLLTPDQLQRRRKQVWKEFVLGIGAMASNIIITMVWMFYIEKGIWSYGFFARHEHTAVWFIGSVIVYMFVFDAWFYWTHRWLHDVPFLWDHVHRIHHQFKEPSAFAQDAVHPLEAIIQGPIGHYLPTLFFPIHPVAHAAFGFFSSVFAVAAHDGRAWDVNDHYYHHCAGKGRSNAFNLSLYFPIWDHICNTRYEGPRMDRQAILKNYKKKASSE